MRHRLTKGILSTIYKDDFDLHGDSVIILADCVLKFEGGHISNGYVVFDRTIISSDYENIFHGVGVGGSIANGEVRLSWWELAYNRNTKDVIRINQIINAIDSCILYYDIQYDVYVGAEKDNSHGKETIAFLKKKNLRVIQPTDHFTFLRGRSTTGSVVRCNYNKYISIDGLKVDGDNVSYSKYGENGIGVVGNENVLIENCIIKGCFSNCYDKEANGTLLKKNGYPEWGAGGKGIQIEGETVSTQATIRNNSIRNCYIGISNNASDQENITMDGNYIDSCYMSMIFLRLRANISMNVNVDNAIIANNTGDVGVICMGNASNVSISNTQIKGSRKVASVLRGCFSYSNIQLIVDQPCGALIDAGLYRDNPEGRDATYNCVKILSSRTCDNVINTSKVIPKRNGSSYAHYVSCEFDVTVQEVVAAKPVILPYTSESSLFKVRSQNINRTGSMTEVNR